MAGHRGRCPCKLMTQPRGGSCLCAPGVRFMLACVAGKPWSPLAWLAGSASPSPRPLRARGHYSQCEKAPRMERSCSVG